VTTPAALSLVEAFAPRPRDPAWLADARAAAFGAFTRLGLPTPRHEDWRFTNLAPLAGTHLVTPAGLAAPVPGAEALLARAAPASGVRLVFENGLFREDLSRRDGLPPGAIVCTLAEAIRDLPDLVRPHLGRLARPEAHAFVAANAALSADGVLVWVPAGAALAGPVDLVFLTGAARGAVHAHPRVLVVAGAGARAAVAEHHLGPDDVPYLSNAVTELVLGEGAEVDHYRLEDEGARAFHVSVLAAEQAAGARLGAHALELGGAIARTEARARLAGEHAGVELGGLLMGAGTQLLDAFSWVEHAVPNGTTTESYKGILDGRARGVFSGRIRVLPGAQKTEARQLNSNLLLSDDAVVDAKPQLEIFADDVKCGHGGTVGQLDPDSLFYLRSRGLGEAEARSVLVWAFAAEVVERIRPAPLRARARRLVASRLPAGVVAPGVDGAREAA
jgi:Fe-S cluster assembly protein SufD